jgi:hypothetical protein
MQNDISNEKRNTERSPKRLTVTLVRRGSPNTRDRSARLGWTGLPSSTSITGSGLGARVVGSSAVVVILARGRS